MKWLGRTHHLGSSSNPCFRYSISDNPQWYNTLVRLEPDTTKLRNAPGQRLSHKMPGRLYVVSTPIGNLDDITVRAINTLKSVGLVAAEDTRRTDILLRHFGIATSTTSLHEHNESQKLPQLLRKLADGVDIALVSDAGTPLVADPGQRLVARAIDRGRAGRANSRAQRGLSGACHIGTTRRRNSSLPDSRLQRQMTENRG